MILTVALFAFAARCIPGGHNPQETIDYVRRCVADFSFQATQSRQQDRAKASDHLYDILIQMKPEHFTEMAVDELIRSYARLIYDDEIDPYTFHQDLQAACIP